MNDGVKNIHNLWPLNVGDFRNNDHPKIKEIRGKGLMLALELDDVELCQKVVHRGIEMGIITFFFLFSKTAVRLSPPLTISYEEIRFASKIILNILDE